MIDIETFIEIERETWKDKLIRFCWLGILLGMCVSPLLILYIIKVKGI